MSHTPTLYDALQDTGRSNRYAQTIDETKRHYEGATQDGQLVMVDNKGPEFGLIVVSKGRQFRIGLDLDAQINLSKLILQNIQGAFDDLVRDDKR